MGWPFSRKAKAAPQTASLAQGEAGKDEAVKNDTVKNDFPNPARAPSESPRDARSQLFDGARQKEDRKRSDGDARAAQRRRDAQKDSTIDGMLAAMAVETQAKTVRSAQNARQQLEQTLEIADSTADELNRQNEQLAGISNDLGKVDHGLKKAGKALDRFERWHIFSGKTDARGKAAEGLVRPPPEVKEKMTKRDMEKAAEKYGASLPPPPHSAEPVVVKAPTGFQWEVVDEHRQRGDNIFQGLQGRDADESETIGAMAVTDDVINGEISQIDGLLDKLAQRAAGLGASAKQENDYLENITSDFEKVNRSVANVNARAAVHVTRGS
ncbi:hypothetical protein M885DRAFT_523164 [Pelagophyceae sp. CCMP2097]|nr:hypothetical protein M885DRAFT_523164 [Pelagophyceae sp. CCMP2097]